MATAFQSSPAETHATGFVILPEFSHLGLAAAIEPLFIANWLLQRELFTWSIASVDGSSVRASNHMMIPVNGKLSVLDRCRTIFVVASFEPLQSARDARLLTWLKRRAAAGTQLIGIENGCLALAFAGLLDRQVTAVHWDNWAGFRELFPRLDARPQLYSAAGRRLTCAGASAIFDLMLIWLERIAGASLAREVTRHLLLAGARSPMEASAASPAADRFDELVECARDMMRKRLDAPIAVSSVAKQLRISQRQLQRRFNKALGHSVHREYELLRMERAHQILQQTDMSVTEVAVACGYGSAAHFARVYRRTFKRAPRADRVQSTDAPVFNRLAAARPRSG